MHSWIVLVIPGCFPIVHELLSKVLWSNAWGLIFDGEWFGYIPRSICALVCHLWLLVYFHGLRGAWLSDQFVRGVCRILRILVFSWLLWTLGLNLVLLWSVRLLLLLRISMMLCLLGLVLSLSLSVLALSSLRRVHFVWLVLSVRGFLPQFRLFHLGGRKVVLHLRHLWIVNWLVLVWL